LLSATPTATGSDTSMSARRSFRHASGRVSAYWDGSKRWWMKAHPFDIRCFDWGKAVARQRPLHAGTRLLQDAKHSPVTPHCSRLCIGRSATTATAKMPKVIEAHHTSKRGAADSRAKTRRCGVGEYPPDRTGEPAYAAAGHGTSDRECRDGLALEEVRPATSRMTVTTKSCSDSVIWWNSGRISELEVSLSVTDSGPCGWPV
jgi:hypothetical protein